MIKILGILDIISGIILILLNYFNLSFGWIFVAYIIIKAVIFFSWISVVDFAVGVIFILSLLGMHSILSIIAAVFLIQKGIFSLLG